MTIHIVGLGPATADLLTQETARLLASEAVVILRTRQHPAVAGIAEAESFLACDDIYDGAAGFDDTYSAVADRVLAQAAISDVVFAVPGNPLVAERSVTVLAEKAKTGGIEVRIYPALSYPDVIATELGEDLGTVQLCDALDLRIDAQRAALIGQVFDRTVAAQLKLELLEIYPPEHEVTHLAGSGTAEARTRRTPLAELDHAPFGHLDSVMVPPLDAIDDVRRLDGLLHIVERLHAPDGCPWDRDQTHISLRHHLLEETYECLEAIDSGDPSQLIEELGDVLLQVLMHSAVGDRSGEFTLADVTEGIARKLIHRHPHVFAEVEVGSADEAWRNWDVLKKEEKPAKSILDGVPVSLPALAASQSIQGRARRAGFDWPDIEGPLEKLAEEIGELARAEGDREKDDEFGDVLFVIANIADHLGIDAEQALRGANAKFRNRFSLVEQLALERSLDLKTLDLPALDLLWDEAKTILAAG